MTACFFSCRDFILYIVTLPKKVKLWQTRKRAIVFAGITFAETDENHYITMEEIARRLQADRRTIEQDIDTLDTIGNGY